MADEWLEHKEIKVDLNSLTDFAELIRKEVQENFMPSFNDGIKPMLSASVPWGGGGMPEGLFYGDFQKDARVALGKMMNDVMTGLTAISVAAGSIAGQYALGDDMAKASNDDVLKAFSEKETKNGKSLDDMLKDTPADKKADESLPKNIQDQIDAAEKEYKSEQSTGDGVSDIYDAQTYGKGDGAYTVEADVQDTHRDSVELPAKED